MQSRRFDKQLQSVFIVLSGLMVVVGLASFGVNRFLGLTQQRVLSESITIIERTERVTQDADFVASLAAQLRDADNTVQVAQRSAALSLRIDRIAVDIDAMRAFLGHDSGQVPDTDLRVLVKRMGGAVDRAIVARAAIQGEREDLADAAARLQEIISTEAKLVRLRITAGIWELYGLPPDGDPRPGLDRLADVNFFAYERLAEMAKAVSTLDRLVDGISAADRVAGLDALGADYAAALALVQARSRFMPSPASQAAAANIARQLSLVLEPDGLLALRKNGIATGAELDGLSALLGRQLGQLIEEARRGRDETRARMQDGVAAAGWQVIMLSAALAGVILLALLAGYLVWARTRQTVVLRLGNVAERMVAVARGDFGAPMPISGQDEIGRLEKALNVLRRRAEDAVLLRNRLEAAVMDRTADVVAEMRAANAARADAEEQSRAKTHFLARMSHEIRTPLNGMIGLLDLLSGEETDPQRRARLQVALTSARDLQGMTEDILAFSAGEEGQGAQQREVFDPAALARGLGEHLTVMAGAKGLTAQVQIAPDLPAALTGEPTKIRQVLINILTNAVKYTPRGLVELSVSAHPAGAGLHDLRLAVRDTGPGMTEEETRQAFDIYGRSVTARRSGVQGVGLGLAIARQLTDAMGAELHVSTAPGQGSRFTLALRLPEADPALVPSFAVPVVPVAGLSVLVVEDHPVNRLVARGYLERMGCRVTEAGTAKAALTAARRGRFDAILVDLGLPDMDGGRLLARIDRKGAKVAVLTADLVQDDAATRAQFGVDRVLTKPVSPRALAAFLDRTEATGAEGQGADRPDTATQDVLRDDIATFGAAQTAGIVAELLADIAEAVPQLRAQTDPVARAKLAHRLKGAAANFRLAEFCALMHRIQSQDEGTLDALPDVAKRAARDLAVAAERVGLRLQPDMAAAKQ